MINIRESFEENAGAFTSSLQGAGFSEEYFFDGLKKLLQLDEKWIKSGIDFPINCL